MLRNGPKTPLPAVWGANDTEISRKPPLGPQALGAHICGGGAAACPLGQPSSKGRPCLSASQRFSDLTFLEANCTTHDQLKSMCAMSQHRASSVKDDEGTLYTKPPLGPKLQQGPWLASRPLSLGAKRTDPPIPTCLQA